MKKLSQKGDQKYEVEAIKGYRRNISTGKRQYLIKWQGFSDLYCTWQDQQNLSDVRDWTRKFRLKQNSQRGKRTAKKPFNIDHQRTQKVKRKYKKPNSRVKQEKIFSDWPKTEQAEQDTNQPANMEVQSSLSSSISNDDESIMEIRHETRLASVSQSHVDGKDVRSHKATIEGIRLANGGLMYQVCHPNKTPIWTDKNCLLLANPEKLLTFYLSHLK